MVSPLVMAVPLAIVSSHTYIMRDRYLWWVLSLFFGTFCLPISIYA